MTSLKSKISFFLTIFYSGVLLLLVWFLFNPFNLRSDLDNLRYAGPSAGRMMERHLEFYEGYEDTYVFEQAIHNFLFGSREQVQQDAIRVYEEVLEYFRQHPDSATPWGILNTKTRKLVTIAETRGISALKEALLDFDQNPEEEVIAEAVKFAYFDEKSSAEFNPEVFTGASLLPIGWAADHLRQRIARKTDNEKFANILQARLHSRGKRLRQHVMYMVITIALIIVTGIILIIRLEILHKISPWRDAILAHPWTLKEGYALAVRAAVFGLLIWLLLLYLSETFFRPGLLTTWSTLFASIPMLWLMHRYLLKPRGFNFRSAFGLGLRIQGLRNLFSITCGLLALEWVGLILIGWGTWQLGLESHWASSIHERLVFGPTETVILSAIAFVIWAPIFEEIGFRGLVYTSIRSHFTPTFAIVITAALFSALHLKSIAGFLSIFWSGLILAYAYERYHSLLPGIIIHAIGNLINLSTVLLFYR